MQWHGETNFLDTHPAHPLSNIALSLTAKTLPVTPANIITPPPFHGQASIWSKLANTHFREVKRTLEDWQNLDMAYILFIDGNHKSVSSGITQAQTQTRDNVPSMA